MRVFNLKSTSGSFEATEVLNPGRSDHVTPYPILQSQLYSADQPGTFSRDESEGRPLKVLCHGIFAVLLFSLTHSEISLEIKENDINRLFAGKFIYTTFLPVATGFKMMCGNLKNLG